MKTLEMSQATGELSSYAEDVQKEPLVVTDQGKPVMALLPIENADLETVSLSTDPRFIALIERSRSLYRTGTGISLQEMRRRHGLESSPGSTQVARSANCGSEVTATRPYQTRYLGNTDCREVHDLSCEQTYCQIDEILEAGHDKPFESLTVAHRAGYDKCAYCLGVSNR